MTVFILLITLLLALACFAKKMPDNMVMVEGGTFEMGGDANDLYDEYADTDDGNEKPIHQITVSSFYIGKFQVTQKEWLAVMGDNPSEFEGDNLPVETISWYDAVEFCNKLSEKEGLTSAYTFNGSDITCDWSANGYRLPTEAEWEYAVRGGKKSKGYEFSGSNNLDDIAWYHRNSDRKTHDVGTKAPNELGIYDMTGNVNEWCWDWYGEDYYHNSPENDPKGPDSGSDHVNRGGCWGSSRYFCHVAFRQCADPKNTFWNLGLRVVRKN
ncbi:MAG TPA: SUMF1/EgtB/PvdO family nonheme iron enzyme [Candidatus Cloacimonadota bacterium]|nr:SUMF1/EgtB/PvdO family nonheme iron enzyme [Candidatus Cloacimonadota bacterium]HQB40980.1 SUMF1/EgtB/PvdO family nonheme iron enzyme [Candidatus Cloacimonadota bacterium]